MVLVVIGIVVLVDVVPRIGLGVGMAVVIGIWCVIVVIGVSVGLVVVAQLIALTRAADGARRDSRGL